MHAGSARRSALDLYTRGVYDEGMNQTIILADCACSTNASLAVTIGSHIMDSVDTGPVHIDRDGFTGETVWSELLAYLSRRGVEVTYETGYPVARRAA